MPLVVKRDLQETDFLISLADRTFVLLYLKLVSNYIFSVLHEGKTKKMVFRILRTYMLMIKVICLKNLGDFQSDPNNENYT